MEKFKAFRSPFKLLHFIHVLFYSTIILCVDNKMEDEKLGATDGMYGQKEDTFRDMLENKV